jgi:predicted deacylase
LGIVKRESRTLPELIPSFDAIDFETPGKRHYQVAFHVDSGWAYSLVPLTVIGGAGLPSPDQPALPGVAIFGGTHGNEWEGQIAVKRLCRDLDAADVSGLVVLIPQLSESACNANQRISPLDNVNMNRAFPGNPKGTLSARIAHFVKTIIFPRVRVVVDLHSGGMEGGFAICTSIHPVPDTRQREEMLKAARLFDTPFVFVYSSDMASGLLTSEAEGEGKIALGGEFGYGETVSRQGVRHAYEGVKNLLRHYGQLTGKVTKVDEGRTSEPLLVAAPHLEAYVPCPRSGIWEAQVDLGQQVERGDLIGFLHNFADHTAGPLAIKTSRAGFVIMMHAPAVTSKGATLYVVAEPVTAV